MTSQTPRQVVFCCLIVSVLSAVGIVVWESLLPDDSAVAVRDEFQTLVGGLGLGPSADLSQCSFGFDPRLQPACSHIDGPIPAGLFLCTKHVGCATGYAALPPSPNLSVDTDDHATSR